MAEHGDSQERVVLAKLAKARFHFSAVPGDTLDLSRRASRHRSKDGAIVSGTSHVGQRLQAETEILFVHLPESRAGKSLFDPAGFLADAADAGRFRRGRDSRRQSAGDARGLLDANSNAKCIAKEAALGATAREEFAIACDDA